MISNYSYIFEPAIKLELIFKRGIRIFKRENKAGRIKKMETKRGKEKREIGESFDSKSEREMRKRTFHATNHVFNSSFTTITVHFHLDIHCLHKPSITIIKTNMHDILI